MTLLMIATELLFWAERDGPLGVHKGSTFVGEPDERTRKAILAYKTAQDCLDKVNF